jgi:hypothetical protein
MSCRGSSFTVTVNGVDKTFCASIVQVCTRPLKEPQVNTLYFLRPKHSVIDVVGIHITLI